MGTWAVPRRGCCSPGTPVEKSLGGGGLQEREGEGENTEQSEAMRGSEETDSRLGRLDMVEDSQASE